MPLTMAPPDRGARGPPATTEQNSFTLRALHRAPTELNPAQSLKRALPSESRAAGLKSWEYWGDLPWVAVGGPREERCVWTKSRYQGGY